MTGEAKNIKSVIPKLYQKQFIDTIVFGFVVGARAADEKITVEKAAQMVQSHFGLSEDELSMGTVRQIFYRMQTDLRDYAKENKTSPFATSQNPSKE